MQLPKNTKKRLTLLAKVLVLALVVWFVRGTLVNAWRELGQHEWTLRPWWLLAACGFYLLGLLPAGLFWWRLLRVCGQQARLGETLRAYYIGHLGKYVPGKAMVVVLRAGLIHGHRVDPGIAAATVFAETLTMMAVGAGLAAAVLAVRARDAHELFFGAVGLAIASLAPTIPPVFRRLARLAGVGRSQPAVTENLQRLGYATLLGGWLSMLVVWGLLALSFWATIRALGVENLGPMEHFTGYLAAVSLSMVAGFLSLIPGGLGVRDAILLKLTDRLLPLTAAEAALAAVMLRLVWLVSELVISGILYLCPFRNSE
ncbi:MAG: lysylphosphatidylglycerol synthase transmembrane domain-containing protein [Patescibacteria group bacterium]|nr:lysylphosphatidylglycerol synthase transmembrane domain-containing protein [Patescibacteria group bacterium]